MSVETTPQKNPASGVIPAAPWRIQAMSVLPGYRLALTFRDGKQGIADLSAIQSASTPGIFTPLADPAFFAQASLQLGAVTWPNGADLDPCWLYEGISTAPVWTVPF